MKTVNLSEKLLQTIWKHVLPRICIQKHTTVQHRKSEISKKNWNRSNGRYIRHFEWKLLNRSISMLHNKNFYICEKMKLITEGNLCLRREMCFGQKRGYLNKMADNSAILNLFGMKFVTLKDNVMVNLNIKFELSTFNRWFFMNS